MEFHLLLLIIAAAALLLRLWFRPPGFYRRRRHQRKQASARRVIERIATIPEPGRRLAYLRKIDPLVFEELILEAFERRGHQVIRNERYTGDGGIDGQVIMRGQLYLVQAKRYGLHVRRQHILDFARLLEQRQCPGLLCHTGRTGEFGRTLNKTHEYLTIISGQRLLDLLQVPSPTAARARA